MNRAEAVSLASEALYPACLREPGQRGLIWQEEFDGKVLRQRVVGARGRVTDYKNCLKYLFN